MGSSAAKKTEAIIWGGLFFLIACYVAFISKLSILRYMSFNSNMFDMGINIQTIWNTLHGRILIETVNNGFPTSKFWFGHWELLFIPIAGIYSIFPSPDTLFIIQSIFQASGAIAVFLLARLKLKNNWASLAVAMAYLFYPALQNANLFDFHGLTLATAPLLFTFYFMIARKKSWFYFFIFLSLLCREDVALIILMFGLYDYFLQKQKKEGIIVSAVGIIWFSGFIFRGHIYSLLNLPPLPPMPQVPSHWAHLGSNSFLGLLVAIFDKPLYVIKFLFSSENIKYIIKLFGPVGFLSFLSPSTVILMAPTLFINLMSNWAHTKSIDYQYTSTITPIVFISLIYGLSFINTVFSKKRSTNYFIYTKYVTSFIVIIILGLSLLSFRFKSVVWNYPQWKVTHHDTIAEHVAREIPQSASVSAETYLGTHAAHRKALYPMPVNMNKADFVFYDFYKSEAYLYIRQGFDIDQFSPTNRYLLSLLKNKDYGIFSFQNGVALFKKGFPYQEGLKNLSFAEINEIENLKKEMITPALLFLGSANKNWVGKHHSVLHLTLFWKKIDQDNRQLSFSYSLENLKNKMRYEHRPVFGLLPFSSWPSEQIIRDELFFSVPEESHHGDYKLYIQINSKKEELGKVPILDVKM